MPRTHINTRQKNKPFKGKKINEGKKNTKSQKTKKIAKISHKRIRHDRQQIIAERKTKRNRQAHIVQTKNQYLDNNSKSIIIDQLKTQTQIKIVLLLPCNQDADTTQIIESLYSILSKDGFVIRNTSNSLLNCPSLEIFPIGGKTNIRSSLHIIAPPRNLQTLQDYVKVADIICPILSCKSTNTQGINLDPYQNSRAFDDIGYITMNLIRSMGLPSTVGIIQHIDEHEAKHHDKLLRLFRRFLQSELGENQKVVNLSEREQGLSKFLRVLDCINPIKQHWKVQRGYFLVQNIFTVKPDTKSVTFQGFLKGNCVHANELVHVTGFDDFQVQKIQIKRHPCKVRKHNKIQEEINLIQYATNPQLLYPFSKKQFETAELDLVNALQQLKLDQENKKNNNEVQMEEDEEFEDISDDEELSFDDEENIGDKADERTKRVELQMRKQDQLQFQDQVEYAAEEILRQKYKQYQGLKSFKNSEWNNLENLPEQYDKIYTFKHFQKTYASVLEKNQSQGFAYPGFYISVTVKNFPIEKIQAHLEKYPLIVTFLHTHERKMTILHAKVRRNPYYTSNNTIFSNKQCVISMGFRRFTVNPIFSRCISGTDKTKYAPKIQQDYQSYFYCSFYYYNYFPPTPVLIHSQIMDSVETSPVMYGELVKCDPMHIILERIILTGYPYKIFNRRSTVRFMFFNPKDVKYFKPVELITKMGLRGRIEQSLGTHGLMKCTFNDKIKHCDTVCMHLYRRVYPTASF